MEPHNVRWWQLLESHLVFITRHFDPTLKKPIMTNWCWSWRQKSGDIEKGKWKRQQRSLLSWISGEGRGLASCFWCLLTTVITELCFFTALLWLDSHISILIMVDLVKVIVKPHFFILFRVCRSIYIQQLSLSIVVFIGRGRVKESHGAGFRSYCLKSRSLKVKWCIHVIQRNFISHCFLFASLHCQNCMNLGIKNIFQRQFFTLYAFISQNIDWLLVLTATVWKKSGNILNIMISSIHF